MLATSKYLLTSYIKRTADHNTTKHIQKEKKKNQPCLSCLLWIVYMFSSTTIHCQNITGIHLETWFSTYHTIDYHHHITWWLRLLDSCIPGRLLPTWWILHGCYGRWLLPIQAKTYHGYGEWSYLDQVLPPCLSNAVPYDPINSLSATLLMCADSICSKENHPSFECGLRESCRF